MNVETMKNKRGKSYRVTLYVNGKKFRSPSMPTKIQAIKWGEEIKMGKRPDRIPLFKEAALERHEKHTKLNCRLSTIRKDEVLFKELFPVMGDRRLDLLRTQEIEDHLINLKNRNKSMATIKQRVTLIKAIFNWHIKRGVCVFNPCLAIQVKVRTHVPEHWTEEQANQFLMYTAQKYRCHNRWVHLLYSLALNTGCRRGEIVGLDWGKISLNKRQILIDQIYDEPAKKIERTTKSGKFRYVGINDTLYELLVEEMKNDPRGLVFKNLVGNPIDRRNFQARHYKPDVKAAGLPHIKFHSLRDTYATIFMANRGNIYHLKELLGHSDIKMTMKYAHFHPDHATQHANTVNIGREGNVIQVDFTKKSLR